MIFQIEKIPPCPQGIPARLHQRQCGEALAKRMLAEYTARPLQSIEIERTENGKPFAKGIPLHFSISHSGDLLCCALSRFPIGIDIELRREIRPDLARRLCAEGENSTDLLALWTAKEAYFKWLGTGIKDLKSITLQKIAPRLSQIKTKDYILSIYQ
jgi:4'-phosphopantetheinyl transferase